MDRRKIFIKQTIKYTILCFSVFLLYILQSTPGFMSILGIKPIFIMPFCFTLSLLDDNWQTGFVYVISGMLMELSAARVIGFYTIPILLFAIVAMVSVKFFFKPSRRNSVLITFGIMIIILSTDFMFSYAFRDFTNVLTIYVQKVVLLSAYSSLFSLLFYYYIDNINVKFIRYDAR